MLTKLLYDKFTTKALYEELHKKSANDRRNRFVFQDVYIPIENVIKFINEIKEFLGIYPLWLYPVKTNQENEYFSSVNLIIL